MAWDTYDDECPGCKPALLQQVGVDPISHKPIFRPVPDDAPEMVALFAVWDHVTLPDRRAFHQVCCTNSREPSDLAAMKRIQGLFQTALNSISTGTGQKN